MRITIARSVIRIVARYGEVGKRTTIPNPTSVSGSRRILMIISDAMIYEMVNFYLVAENFTEKDVTTELI